MIFLAAFILMCAGVSSLATGRRVVDTDNVKLSLENDSYVMELAVENPEDVMENIGALTEDVVGTTNMTEVSRRRMRWEQCNVYKGSHPAQFLYLNGICYHIKSWGTLYNWYGRNVYRTIRQSTMNSCRKGGSISVGWLARGSDRKVYAIYNGRKHHIYNPRTMSRCRFNWGMIVSVPQRIINYYPTGRTIRA